MLEDEVSTQDLMMLAGQLFGTNIDLGQVTYLVGDTDEEEQVLRSLLRQRCSLAQDPISGVWFQVLSSLKVSDLAVGQDPPTE